MLELKTHKCRHVEIMALRRQVRQQALKTTSRIKIRRLWVLFSVSLLSCGVWDYAVSQQHPSAGTFIAVGSVLSAMTFVLMLFHEQHDRSRTLASKDVLSDADRGEFQTAALSPIERVTRVSLSGPREQPEFAGYYLESQGDSIYLSGPELQTAIDEYHFRQLEAGIEDEFTFSRSLTVEFWPISKTIRDIVLSGPQLPFQVKNASPADLGIDSSETLTIRLATGKDSVSRS